MPSKSAFCCQISQSINNQVLFLTNWSTLFLRTFSSFLCQYPLNWLKHTKKFSTIKRTICTLMLLATPTRSSPSFSYLNAYSRWLLLAARFDSSILLLSLKLDQFQFIKQFRFSTEFRLISVFRLRTKWEMFAWEDYSEVLETTSLTDTFVW